MEAVKRGEQKIDVCQRFDISRNTLDLWLKPEAEMGNGKAIVNFQKGCGHKITDGERFRQIVTEYGDKTQGQRAQLCYSHCASVEAVRSESKSIA